MTELKTLRELADENGLPLVARWHNEKDDKFTAIAFAPSGDAVGWSKNGFPLGYDSNEKAWTLAPKKKVLKSFVYQSRDGKVYPSLEYVEDVDHYCTQVNGKLIKILDEIEVDV